VHSSPSPQREYAPDDSTVCVSPSTAEILDAQAYGAIASVPAMKVRALVRLLEDQGWRLVRTRGSHRQFKHALFPGTLTVAGKASAEMPPGTLSAILKQAKLKR
jgi:predicted RNA binding protein YcfA (HicA-like mRNA interferase family)